MNIKIQKPTPDQLKALNIDAWSTWACPPSSFEWEYEGRETAYVFEGRVTVTTPFEEVSIGKGDLVIFPKGLKCKWTVHEAVRKVYKFD